MTWLASVLYPLAPSAQATKAAVVSGTTCCERCCAHVPTRPTSQSHTPCSSSIQPYSDCLASVTRKMGHAKARTGRVYMCLLRLPHAAEILLLLFQRSNCRCGCSRRTTLTSWVRRYWLKAPRPRPAGCLAPASAPPVPLTPRCPDFPPPSPRPPAVESGPLLSVRCTNNRGTKRDHRMERTKLGRSTGIQQATKASLPKAAKP